MGCGRDILDCYVNADSIGLPGVALVADFSRPFPFKDNSFSMVNAVNVIEHLPDTVKVMEEIWRVSKAGARVHIKVPHYKSSNAFKDPTHRSFFTEDSFEYFDTGRISRYSKAKFRVAEVKKTQQYDIDRFVRRPLPPLLPFVERFQDSTIEGLEFDLVAAK
jgi:SAM-dependent methyltransferase